MVNTKENIPDFLKHKFIKIFEESNNNTRLLYLPLNSTERNQNATEQAFIDCGVNLCSFDYRLFAYETNVLKANDIFLQLVCWFKPNIIHMQLQFSNIILPNTLKQVKKLLPNVFISNWTGDIRNSPIQYFIDVSKEIDLSLISSVGQIELYKKHGCKNVDYWQAGFDPKYFYRKSDEERKFLCEKYNHDIIFCGNGNKSANFPGTELRQNIISVFYENFGDRFCAYGTGYKFSRGKIAFFQQNDTNNGAKIILSVNHFNDVEKYFSNRQLVSMATGTLTLSKYIPGLEDYFENHKHLVWFNDEYEALDLAKYYLKNEKKREEIGKEGAKIVLSYHSYFQKVSELLEKINTKVNN